METLRNWAEVISNGGWTGGIVAGLTILLVMFAFSFISNRYVWAVVIVAVAAVFGTRYLGWW